MLNVKGNFPGSSNNTLCTYCHTGPETQQHLMKECTGFDDLTGEGNLNQLVEKPKSGFQKGGRCNMICKVIDRIKLGQKTNQNHAN